MPSIRARCTQAGRRVRPSPTATRLSADVIRGASWPSLGLNPALRQAAIVTSENAGPTWRADDECFASEILQRDRRAVASTPRQRVIARQRRHHRLDQQWAIQEILRCIHVRAHESDIHQKFDLATKKHKKEFDIVQSSAFRLLLFQRKLRLEL